MPTYDLDHLVWLDLSLRDKGVLIVNGTSVSAKTSSNNLESRTTSAPLLSTSTSMPLPPATTISQRDPTEGLSSPTSPPLPASPQAPREGHVVPIIAGTLGSVIGVLILLGLLIWLKRRRKRNTGRSHSMEDSIVILDTAQTTPMRQGSRRDKQHEPVRKTRRIDGTARPPEFYGMAEDGIWDRVVFMDQLGGAVRQMGF
ncbi:MAG: hypothetical protein Q9169_002905 [Polycauliona sp. 2 TL-2023]